jgi:hypothetical protein
VDPGGAGLELRAPGGVDGEVVAGGSTVAGTVAAAIGTGVTTGAIAC